MTTPRTPGSSLPQPLARSRRVPPSVFSTVSDGSESRSSSPSPLSPDRAGGAQTSVSSDIVRAHLRPRTLASFAATFPPSASCLSPLPSPPPARPRSPRTSPRFWRIRSRHSRVSPSTPTVSSSPSPCSRVSESSTRASPSVSDGNAPGGRRGARAPSSSNETPRRPQSAPRRTRRRRRRRNRTRAHAPRRRRGKQRRVARLWSLESATASPPDRPLSARRRPRRRPLRRPRRRPRRRRRPLPLPFSPRTVWWTSPPRRPFPPSLRF